MRLAHYDPIRLLHCSCLTSKPQLWLARSAHLPEQSIKKCYVIKLLPDSASFIEQCLIQNEIQVMQGLQTPNYHAYWMPLIEAGQGHTDFLQSAQTLHYLVMPYFECGNLTQALRQNRFSLQQKGRLFLHLLDAIAALHQHNWLHLDLKPSNILLNSDSIPVLTDFALAQHVMFSQRKKSIRLTQGTPKYMSPEQFLGQPLNPQTDLYSLGLILYEMLAGKMPYQASSYEGWAVEHCQQAVPLLIEPLAQFQPLVDGLLAKNRQNRLHDPAQIKNMAKAAFQLNG
ncbi:serine/threonine-protein kinase [Alkanindiges sp. WGS2144]|uniref:serine/threonine-protein kinase n=1 Tax=Alkanindiges sp. WGS2144 TaxID=3366808 RepID=UPI003750AB53